MAPGRPEASTPIMPTNTTNCALRRKEGLLIQILVKESIIRSHFDFFQRDNQYNILVIHLDDSSVTNRP